MGEARQEVGLAGAPAWALAFLRDARVGRLATADASARPLVVPICYVFDGARCYSVVDAKPKRARDLRRLRNIAANPRAALVADAQRPDGRTVALLTGAFANAGTLLAEDAGARERLNRAAEGVLITLLPSGQAQLSDFIAGVVGNWDAKAAAEKIELRVGRDLQYVRINGTLVGFLAGGALFALLTKVFGGVAH